MSDIEFLNLVFVAIIPRLSTHSVSVIDDTICELEQLIIEDKRIGIENTKEYLRGYIDCLQDCNVINLDDATDFRNALFSI